jgi:hypothetical protein
VVDKSSVLVLPSMSCSAQPCYACWLLWVSVVVGGDTHKLQTVPGTFPCFCFSSCLQHIQLCCAAT